VAPSAFKKYTPGDFSAVYRGLNLTDRKAVDVDAERLFVLKTGVTRKIDPANPLDKPYMRQWLLIRDTVIAIRKYDEAAANDRKQRDLQAKIELEWSVAEAARMVTAAAPPLEVKGSLGWKVAAAAHYFVEAADSYEIFVGIWPHVLEFIPAALEAYGGVVPLVNIPLGMIVELHEIQEAHELGEHMGNRHAYLYGVACTLANGRVLNLLPENTEIGRYQRLGLKVAVALVSQLPARLRGPFVARYRRQQSYPGQNVDNALRDFGYLVRTQ
jgi:hypothetical protein